MALLGCGRPEFLEFPPQAPEPPPVCADCGGRVMKLQYGLPVGGIQYIRMVQVAGGDKYWLARFGEHEFLVGGCCIQNPGWACIACGRVWPLLVQETFDRR